MRRFFLVVGLLALFWTGVVMWTGGAAFRLGSARLSSRSVINPLILAAAGVAAAWLLSPRGRQARTLADDLRACAAPLSAAVIAVSVMATGILEGARVAGGADSYGYVSQAEAWAAGRLEFDEPLIREFAGRVHRDAFVPLGYHAIGGDGRIVPVYSPGFPMVMGVFQRVGGREAVFHAVPVLAGIAIWVTYVMGVRLAGKAVGVAAAAILATSPSFLFQVTAAPMSDVPVTAWWALALALALFNSPWAACLSGVAAGIAILTRPNLVPLALIPFATLAWDAVRQRSMALRHVARPLLFAAGVAPGCVAVGALFTLWYGSPLISGYGSMGALYQWPNVWPNLVRYPSWIVETETPIVILAFAAPWLVTRVARIDHRAARVATLSWVGFIVAVLASYLLYKAFDAVWFVRFMLPAFPPLFVLTSVAIVASTSRLTFWPRVLIPVALVGVVTAHGLTYAYRHGVFDAHTERKYADAGEYVMRRLPQRAAVLTMLHSGSIRYYSGRPTVRLDVIPPSELDSTVSALSSSGYHPFLLFEPDEVPVFRERYMGHSALAALDWPPIALLRASNLRFYDPADRARTLAGRPPLTETMP